LLRGGVTVSMAVHGGVLCKDGGVTTAPRTWTKMEVLCVKIWSWEEEDGALQMQRDRNWCRCCFDVDGATSVKVRMVANGAAVVARQAWCWWLLAFTFSGSDARWFVVSGKLQA